MKLHEIIWEVSFLKQGISIIGIPIKWVIKNSKIWVIRLTTNGYHRITTDGSIRAIKR